MARYIDADALKVAIQFVVKKIGDSSDWLLGYADGLRAAMAAIDEAPTIEVRPVVRGGWIEKREPIPWCEDDVDVFFECSVCGANNCGESPFCPNCGAMMEGEKIVGN